MNQSMRSQTTRRGGFSIIELLIALIIISILSLIAVPTIANRARDARIKRAMVELEKFQEAQQRAAIDTGYYYRLHVLNDVPGGDGLGWGDGADDDDGIQDEQMNNEVGNPRLIFINTSTQDLLNGAETEPVWTALLNRETQYNWQGPYLTWQEQSRNEEDFPLDPWGNPYLLFTAEGLVMEPTGQMLVSDAHMAITAGYYQGYALTPSRFDRMTVLSLGPDGQVGDGGTEIGHGDDLKSQW